MICAALVVGIVELAIWLWNLWDAYTMNQRLLGKSSELLITPNLTARREQGAFALRYQALHF